MIIFERGTAFYVLWFLLEWKNYHLMNQFLSADDVAFGSFLLDITYQLQQAEGRPYCSTSFFCVAFFCVLWWRNACKGEFTRAS